MKLILTNQIFMTFLSLKYNFFQFNYDFEGIKLQSLLALYESYFYFLMSTEYDLSVKFIVFLQLNAFFKTR